MATDPRRCAINRELISSLLDGELAFDERAQLMNHLAGCPECRALLDGYRAIGTQLRAMPAAQAPRSCAPTSTPPPSTRNRAGSSS